MGGSPAGSPAPARRSPARYVDVRQADRKGGHLAIRIRDGQLVLRDSAQTAPEDEDAFADVTRHRFFNSNNLWVDLERSTRCSVPTTVSLVCP